MFCVRTIIAAPKGSA